MEENLKDIIRKLLKKLKLSTKVHNCINTAIVKKGAKNLQELLVMAKKCLGGNSGGNISETDLIIELQKFYNQALQEVQEEKEELEAMVKEFEKLENKSKKIPPIRPKE